jgi:type IV secretory pathway TrbL component
VLKSFKFLFICLAIAMLHGCASQQEKQTYAKSLSDQELCMDWMTSARMNQYQSARESEISARRLNCWKYGNIAEEQRKAQADFNNAVQRASGQQVQTQTPRRATPSNRSSGNLVNEWIGRNADRFCQYSDGTIRNVGVDLCPK